MIARALRDVAVVCLLLVASDAAPRQFTAPLDGVTWSPYRPVYVHEHHIPMRSYGPDTAPPEWI